MAHSLNVFYTNVIKHLKTTGSIAPSSRFLAAGMTRCVDFNGKPLALLEGGPGTGPFTTKIASLMRDQDTLDLCELNDGFVQHLRELISSDHNLNHHQERITLYHQSVTDLEGENRYDYILSGLPFNNFDPGLVTAILETYQRLLKPGGRLAFFEYAWFRFWKAKLVLGKDRQRVQAIHALMSGYFNDHEVERYFVLGNLPPAVVHVCEFDR